MTRLRNRATPHVVQVPEGAFMGKCKCPPAGAPEWVLTYGDLMSLLLCFFILLAALSEIKDDSVWRATAEEVKKSFGLHGGGGPIPTSEFENMGLIRKLEKLYMQQQKDQQNAAARDPATHGREMRVSQSRKDIRRGVGSVTFEPGTAELSDAAKASLRAISALIKGYNNKIQLQGHAAANEVAAGGGHADLWTLSYARAKVVMDYLVNDQGIDPDRIRLIANADKEPMKKREYDARALEPNRRVEIEINDQLIADFTKPVPN